MRARRIAAGSGFRLLQDEQEIGYVDSTRVSFRGFATRDDAALAASVAHRALTRRRGEQRHSVDELKDILVVDQGSTQAVIARAGILARIIGHGLQPSHLEALRKYLELAKTALESDDEPAG